MIAAFLVSIHRLCSSRAGSHSSFVPTNILANLCIQDRFRPNWASSRPFRLWTCITTSFQVKNDLGAKRTVLIRSRDLRENLGIRGMHRAVSYCISFVCILSLFLTFFNRSSGEFFRTQVATGREYLPICWSAAIDS